MKKINFKSIKLPKINLNKKYLLLSILMFVFLIFMILSDSITKFNWTVEKINKANTVIEKYKFPIEHKNWIVPFYFTFQSNVMVFLYITLRAFGLICPNKNKSIKMFQMITLTNITVTFVGYWLLLAPFSSIWTHSATGAKDAAIAGAMKITGTLMVHLISPFIMMYIFSQEKKAAKIILTYKDLWKFLIYPVLWLILAIIVYYATRHQHSFTKQVVSTGDFKLIPDLKGSIKKTFGVGVYFFIFFDLFSPMIPIGAISMLTIFFLITSTIYIAISNPSTRLYKWWNKLILK